MGTMFITDTKRLQVAPTDEIRTAILAIDVNELQTALVVDAAGRLLGIVTDGDVRRGLLRGAQLSDSVATIQNEAPLTAPAGASPQYVDALMQRSSLFRIPLVDEAGRVVALAVALPRPAALHDNLVVLMAGGLGTRLGELTRDTPKPLLNVGPHPILETIVEGFCRQGFHRFAISVNYRAEMIERYFGDGSRWGAHITYLREDRRLGTAGALGLLPALPQETLLVMNADVLTRVDYRRMLDFHAATGAAATMAVRDYSQEVPFGVVELSEEHVTQLVEKPVTHYFINAGIYALEPECLELVPAGEYYDMTSLLVELLHNTRKVSSFPVHEYWQDVGRPADLSQAREVYSQVFHDREGPA